MRPFGAYAIPVFDSGVRSGTENNALDHDALRRSLGGLGRDLLRFHRSQPTASLGRFQTAEHEIRLDYCARRGIEVIRRPTGGGALYLNPDCLQFSLVLGRCAPGADRGLGVLLNLAGQAMGEGLRHLGIGGRFKSPNDLEVDGRKIASVFAVREGNALLVQGTLLLDADIRAMLETLRVPTEKLSPDGLSAARDRLATVKECLGEVPAGDAVRGALERGLATVFGLRLNRERGAARDFLPRADVIPGESVVAGPAAWGAVPDGAFEAVTKGLAATLRVRAEFMDQGTRFRRVAFAGDLHLDPPERLDALSAALAGLPLGLARRFMARFFQEHPSDMVGFAAEDLARLLELVADKSAATRVLGLERAEANALMVFDAGGQDGARQILEKATAMLVPYCAKPAWCKWRHLDGCSECGLCEVGEAYKLARERGMQVTTVTRYEHLVETLAEMKRRRVPAYVGMCCSNFFIKRHRAFREAGMPAVLMDVSGANCYELRQEDQAYAGTFSAEARIDAAVLHKLMRFVPGSGDRARGATARDREDEDGS